MAIFVGVGIANAAVRDENSRTRQPQKNITTRTQNVDNVSRTTKQNVVSRNAVTARTASRATTTERTRHAGTISRAASTVAARTSSPTTTARAGTTANASRPARATVISTATPSATFDTGYNICRDAYFTCMDQFCANANDTYRRCVCSSKLTEIQSRENALTQAGYQIQDFKDLNISVINKTANEVNAMLSATTGEKAQASARDKSDSALKLAGISDILSKTKSNSLSTAGQLDVAGDINQIWSTTDLTGGQNISGLTGESLYNAVHSQCAKMVATQCASDTTLKMVTSAYGMYIENDCSLLINALDKKLNEANATIRDTEREMQLARLENYNEHNSSTIHDCISQVRSDITSPNACGADYVHCLDITGMYLSYDTGEPIYTPNFYQLENQTTLSGDILTNQVNSALVAKLNGLRDFASRGLDTCRDLADDVWSEFLRQAITEIHQGQQERIRQVKNNCLQVINQCYDTQTNQIKDFSNSKTLTAFGARLELAEEMCQEKMDACSNLYGGGTNGMQELVIAMSNITDQKIAQQCAATLRDFAKKQCAVPGNDTLHVYPYGCRVYAPGAHQYAQIAQCNQATGTTKADVLASIKVSTSAPSNLPYQCNVNLKKYTSCKAGYIMTYNGYADPTPKFGNKCLPCPAGYTCSDYGKKIESKQQQTTPQEDICGDDYIGSLYHKMARHAAETCVRQSDGIGQYELPFTILQDLKTVMSEIQQSMSNELARECERLGGKWVSTPWQDATYQKCTKEGLCEIISKEEYEENKDNKCDENVGSCSTYIDAKYVSDEIHDITGDQMYTEFYRQTSTNPRWGYCTNPDKLLTNNDTSDSIEDPDVSGGNGNNDTSDSIEDPDVSGGNGNNDTTPPTVTGSYDIKFARSEVNDCIQNTTKTINVTDGTLPTTNIPSGKGTSKCNPATNKLCTTVFAGYTGKVDGKNLTYYSSSNTWYYDGQNTTTLFIPEGTTTITMDPSCYGTCTTKTCSY